MGNPEERKATAAEDFGPAAGVFDLPVPGPGGSKLWVEVEAAVPEDLIVLSGALFAMGQDNSSPAPATPEGQLAVLNEQAAAARAVVERYVRAPRISFDGPQAGSVEWKSLHIRNRIAIIQAITNFSRDGSVEGVERLATFPAIERGGGPRGGGDGPAVVPGGGA